MIRRARRYASVVLAAALVGGLIPPDAARAAGVIEAGAVSEAGVSAAAGPAGAFSAPTALPSAAAFTAPLSAPALSFSAPLAAPAAAPAAAPIAAAAFAPAASAPSLSAAAAADPSAAPESEKTPAPAAAPAAAPRTAAPASAARGALARLSARVARLASLASFAAPAAAPASKAAGDAAFDGASAPARAEAAPEAAPAPARKTALSRVADWAGRRVGAYRAKRAADHDGFGGPKPASLDRLGQLREGAKTGLRLVGVATLIEAAAAFLRPLPWPLFLSPERMNALGRVELLINYGPKEIQAALVHAPLTFLSITMPMSAAIEEFTYRFWDFGIDFALLALARPIAGAIAKALEQVPDGSGFRSKAQTAVRAIGGLVSYYAFPAAAALSALKFAEAHFAHWGYDPALFAINVAAALALTKLAYKTRGLIAPLAAHITFNLAMLTLGVVAISLHAPLAGVFAALGVSIAGVYSVLRARAAARGLNPFRGRRFFAKVGSGLLLALALLAPLSPFQTYPVAVHGQNAAAAAAAQPDASKPVVVADSPVAAAAASPAAAPVEAAADMVARVKPSVLKIVVKMDQGYAIGSGVIVSPEGLAVTNGHVVGDRQPGETVMVELASGQQIPAKIVAVNHDRDLALLQLPPRVKAGSKDSVAWPTSALATDAPREGDEVFAMGHPLNLPFTVTRGIVSGRGMRGNMYVQYLQTDASINHGNSGGPLYNARGEVVGINTMIFGADGSIGLGFSISADSVAHALAQFKAAGNINTASLGVVVDLSNPVQPAHGVRVEYVVPGSAAARAGLMPGDVIVGLGGATLPTAGGVESARSIAGILSRAKPGDKISVLVLHRGQPGVATLTLDAKRTTAETSGAHDFAGAPTP